jgi:NAD-dependent SIR2 family protein deacetylase
MREDAISMHGIFGAKLAAENDWEAPRLVVECDADARPGYTTKKAHEYEEEPRVLVEKVKLLASLLLKAKYPLAYTGAGISTSSGINDYASKAKNSLAMKRKQVSGFDAQPTLAHRVLAALHRRGKLVHWVQQNHDGLPQKAGFPPECLNEIHGAWYDPSNPVVPMTGSLRGDLCEWMEEWEEKTDLCLAMGTSLCGMNADRMVETPSQKLREGCGGLGAVIVGLQQTQYDAVSSLRIYAKINLVMALLAKELLLDVLPNVDYNNVNSLVPTNAVVNFDREKLTLLVPYDKKGKVLTRCTKTRSSSFSSSTTTTEEEQEQQEEQTWKLSHLTKWDLSNGSKVKVTMGPGKGYIGKITGRDSQGHILIRLPLQREGHKDQGRVWSTYRLGLWWLKTAANGTATRLPIVNVPQSSVLTLQK